MLAVPGVKSAHAFVTYVVQREHRKKPLRMQVQGLSWPEDKVNGFLLVSGRGLGAAHFEMVADKILGLRLGEKFPCKGIYTVVGITSGMYSMAGTEWLFSVSWIPWRSNSISQVRRLDWSARLVCLGSPVRTLVRLNPLLEEFNSLAGLPDIAPPAVSAVLVQLQVGTDPASVIATLSGWTDISVFTRGQQGELLLKGVVDRARRQLGLFRAILVIISAIIMASFCTR